MKVPGWSIAALQTIQDICNKRLGLLSRSAAEKPLLTDKMVKKRLAGPLQKVQILNGEGIGDGDVLGLVYLCHHQPECLKGPKELLHQS